MPPEPADRNALDPDAISGHAFTRARKGYEVDEVRAFLVNIGSRVREAQQHFDDLQRRVTELERRAVDPKDLDEDAVTQLLGEETARVLDTARKAANEIRAKAEEQANTTVAAADEQATATRDSADAYAQEVRAAVDQEATTIRTAADRYAQELRETADTETTALRSGADTYAAEIRAEADADVAEQRATAEADVTRMRAESESVLADRTAEAELAAGGIRADADTYSSRVREDADRYAEATRTAADSYRADVQGAADAYRDTATTDGDRIRSEALADAEATRAGADADAVSRRQAAEAEVEAIIADAREQGRQMVQEARDYRERVIADLADRRRAARTQLEQLAATRDSLAVTLSDVASRIESSHRALQEAVLDPRQIGEPAQDRRALGSSGTTGTSVGVGELGEAAPAPDEDPDGNLEAEATGDLQPPATPEGDDDPDDDPDGGGPRTNDPSDVTEGLETVGEVTDAEPADTADDEAADDEANPVDRAAQGSTIDGSSEAEGGDAEVDHEAAVAVVEDEAPETEATEQASAADTPSADDIFARLRAERADAPPEETGTADLEAAAIAEEAAEPTGATDEAGEPAGAEGDSESPDESDSDEDEDEDRDPDVDLLDRRDATTDELERQLARRLKRVLSDEQNEALDLLRRTKGTPSAAEVLPSEADHLKRYTSAALEDLTAAERAGAAFFGKAPRRKADVRDVANEFAAEMVRQIRGRLERAFDDGGDEQEVGERIRACYREWKTQRIAETARHYVVVAFSRGVVEAAPDGTDFRWLVDDDGPCPDCDDNALAGGNPKGEPFPTGDLCPPAHPGCRCLAVPVQAA
ncbi:MAG TPA: DivIVA domain-containing protein [Aquihabitans sp.]|nr:DivIVA domain-containing protein [Aquihabitans sp.]